MSAVPKKINLIEMALDPLGNGGGFQCLTHAFGRTLGAQKLGMRLVVLEPGKKAFPRHTHEVNEEAFIVLEGSGVFRLGEEEIPVTAMDAVVAKAGTGKAHQMVNTSEAPLKYLAISTMELPEVCTYPDSGKVLMMYGPPPDEQGDSRKRLMFMQDATVDYWEGEES